jgi:hypothetical protein
VRCFCVISAFAGQVVFAVGVGIVSRTWTNSLRLEYDVVTSALACHAITATSIRLAIFKRLFI